MEENGLNQHQERSNGDYRHHRRGIRAGIKHMAASLVGAHSHDHADSIDSALESSARGLQALVISFGVLMATAAVQVAVYAVTGSVALLADTVHNFSDALTAVPLFIAFRIGRRAANKRYTYGYRRAEDIAGLFVVLMILLSAIVVAWESIERLINPEPVNNVAVLFAAGVVGFIGNELVALYRVRVGRQIGSAALVADGLHARADGLTSLAVALGAILVWLGLDRADPVVGILVAIAILGVLRAAGRDIYRRLMDAVDPSLVEDIERVVTQVEGVDGVTACRVRWLGHRLRADIAISVNGQKTVDAGHAIGEIVKSTLKAEVRHLDDAFIHVDSTTTHEGPADRPVGAAVLIKGESSVPREEDAELVPDRSLHDQALSPESNRVAPTQDILQVHRMKST